MAHNTTARRMPRTNMMRRGGALQGCLIVLAVVVLLVIGGVVFVMMSWKGWAAAGIDAAAEGLVAETSLPPEEQQQVLALTSDVSQGFKDGDISFEELGLIMQEMATGPILPASIASGFDSEYVAPSGLSDEDKEAARLAVDRLSRGLAEGTISQSRLPAVMEAISAPMGTEGAIQIDTGEMRLNLKPPGDVTDEEIQAVIAAAIEQADEAGVPNERYDFDMSDELSRAIRDALGRELPSMTGLDGAAEEAPAEDDAAAMTDDEAAPPADTDGP